MGSYSFVVEYDAAPADVYRIRGNLRAFRHGDNPQTAIGRGAGRITSSALPAGSRA
jgi:hypothetical protein